jgi:hypothetical protein
MTETITEDQVYRKFVNLCQDPFNPTGGAINIVNLASLLGLNKYKTRKLVHALRDKGLVVLKCFDLSSEDDDGPCPPYWGYVLTSEGRDTDYYREAGEEQRRIMVECFGP